MEIVIIPNTSSQEVRVQGPPGESGVRSSLMEASASVLSVLASPGASAGLSGWLAFGLLRLSAGFGLDSSGLASRLRLPAGFGWLTCIYEDFAWISAGFRL